MGEVWRATDTRLKCQVALKVRPAPFVRDLERIARFQREAEVLAALNHPNIAQIYGIEEADDVTTLVLELVEGETLADLIAQGRCPEFREMLRQSRLFITEGLLYAVNSHCHLQPRK